MNPKCCNTLQLDRLLLFTCRVAVAWSLYARSGITGLREHSRTQRKPAHHKETDEDRRAECKLIRPTTSAQNSGYTARCLRCQHRN